MMDFLWQDDHTCRSHHQVKVKTLPVEAKNHQSKVKSYP